MTLYLDITKSHTQDQIIEEIQFNLSMAMDKISEDVDLAESAAAEGLGFDPQKVETVKNLVQEQYLEEKSLFE